MSAWSMGGSCSMKVADLTLLHQSKVTNSIWCELVFVLIPKSVVMVSRCPKISTSTYLVRAWMYSCWSVWTCSGVGLGFFSTWIGAPTAQCKRCSLSSCIHTHDINWPLVGEPAIVPMEKSAANKDGHSEATCSFDFLLNLVQSGFAIVFNLIIPVSYTHLTLPTSDLV